MTSAFRLHAKSQIARISSVLRLHAEKLERIIFNETIEILDTKGDDVNEKTFRGVYNWLTQVLLIRHMIVEEAINENTISPKQLLSHLIRQLQLLPHAVFSQRPSDDTRLAARLFAIRKFSEVVSISQALELEERIAASQASISLYKKQFHIVYANLKNAKTGLLSKIEDGVLKEDIGQMTHKTIWPELWQQPHMQTGHRIHIIQDTEQQAPSMIQCRACKQYTVSYVEVQTRSADEPMTVFCACKCGKRWKM